MGEWLHASAPSLPFPAAARPIAAAEDCGTPAGAPVWENAGVAMTIMVSAIAAAAAKERPFISASCVLTWLHGKHGFQSSYSFRIGQMTGMPFVLGPQPALEADPGHKAEFGVSFLSFDIACEPAIPARKTPIFPWTVEAFQLHRHASRDRDIEQH